MKKTFLILITCLLYTFSATAQTYWDGTANKVFDGSGTQSDPYLIGTPEQLAGLAARTNVDKEDFAGKYVKLTADIYLTDFSNPDQDSWKEWEPIAHSLMQYGEDIDNGYFRGHFDGAGHTIYNMYYGKGMNWAADFDPDDLDVDLGDYDYSVMNKALFVNLDGGTIENLKLKNAKMSGVRQALLVNSAKEGSVIRNCHVQGELRATSGSSSGLVLYNDGLIENCSANIRSDLQNCSGLVGTNGASGVVRNCSTNGFIRVTMGNGAGFVDDNRGLIEGSNANVHILALSGPDDNVNHEIRHRSGAGFVMMNSGIIRDCGAVGGLDSDGSTAWDFWRTAISGFAYRNWDGRIESCYATGDLCDVSDSTGVGGDPEFATFCYSNGQDAFHIYMNTERGDILNCYSTSSITHHDANSYRSSIHAFLSDCHTPDGGMDGNLKERSVQFACYFNQDGLPNVSSKADTSWGGIGKSLTEMKSQAFVDTLNMAASFLGTSQWELRDGLPRPTGSKVKDATVVFGGGNGTNNNPYQIATKKHLENLRWLVNAGYDFQKEYVLQTADIALNTPREQWEYEAPQRWTPIAFTRSHKYYTRPITSQFAGVYDGGFHEVQNMYINSMTEADHGLFGTLSKNVLIRNLGVTGAYIRADGNVGILAGSMADNGVIMQCWTSGDVSWKTQNGATIGGIVGTDGQSDKCQFVNNYSSAIIRGGSGTAKGNYSVWTENSLFNFLFTGNFNKGTDNEPMGQISSGGFQYYENDFSDKDKTKIAINDHGISGTEMPTEWIQSKELVNIFNYSVTRWNATHDGELQLNYWEWHQGEYPRVSTNSVWRPDVKITFNSNGGAAVVDKYIVSGSEALPPQRPLRDGYIFAGWYKDPGLTKFFDWQNERPTSNLTLYARWLEDKRFEIDTMPFENEFATKIHIKTAAQLRGFAAIVNGVYDWGEKVPYNEYDSRPAYQRYPVSTILVPDALEGKTVVLDNDILLCDTTDWQYWGRGAFGLPWKPIGSPTDVSNEGDPTFKGTFDGQGHVIYGMYIEKNGMPGWDTSGINTGLFGTLSGPVTIQNVGVAASVIDGQDYNTRGQSNDAVWYWRRQGYGSQNWYHVGMLAGSISGECTVKQCFVQGNIHDETSYLVAGLTGELGGFATDPEKYTINDCYSRVNIYTHTFDPTYIPEDYGFAVLGRRVPINNCYSAGHTYHSFCNDDDSNGINVKDCYYDKTLVTVIDRPATPATPNAMHAKATFKNWDFENVWGSNDAINDGYPYLRIFQEEVIPDDPDPILVTGITLDQSEATIIAGNTLQLKATVTPEEAKNKKVIWTSSINDEKFSIDENGLVTTELGLNETVIITATTDEGNYVATCTLKVVNPRIDGIHPVAYRRVGETKWKFKSSLSVELENIEYMVLAYTEPDEANDGILWSTSDPEVLSITEMTDTAYTFYFWGNKVEHNCCRALVRCLKSTNNPVTLQASLANGVKYESANINVRRAECTKIKSICKYPLEVWAESPDGDMPEGEQQHLTVEIDDYISYLPVLKWSSSNSAVLSVDENGIVTAVSPGTAIITVSIPNTDISATTEITVNYLEVVRGDADGDGTVDVNDVTTTINHILGKPVAKFVRKAANVDGDDSIDVNDVQGIIDIALGKAK